MTMPEFRAEGNNVYCGEELVAFRTGREPRYWWHQAVDLPIKLRRVVETVLGSLQERATTATAEEVAEWMNDVTAVRAAMGEE
jgi:hypothetical protein